ncbi:MAG: WXG100 family type VII secretion target [Oscillospiraceae bacterium]|jgi:WXG100 family type VII secretion target|nr:WXG100 family type VII secretion target [Oscillospiraceae bacterium]
MGTKIVVDPAKLEQSAQKVEQQAQDYTQLYQQLYTEVDSMGSAWQGKDNQAYVTQIKGFEDDFQGMVAQLKQYAEFLRQSAKAYRSTQENVESGAHQLRN